MKLYRLLTGPDDSAFCKRVSGALSKGWELAGSPSLTYDPVKQTVIAAQAVTKEIPDVEFSDDIKLSDW